MPLGSAIGDGSLCHQKRPKRTVPNVTKKSQREPSPMDLSELFEGAGKLVGARGAAAVAVYTVQAGYYIGDLHAGAE